MIFQGGSGTPVPPLDSPMNSLKFVLFPPTGIRNFIKDVEMMVGKKPWIVWAYYVTSWCVVTPIAIIVSTFTHL